MRNTLILASSSPRRKELLTIAGIPFVEGLCYKCDESYPADMPTHAVAEYLASKKSNLYPKEISEKQILLTADTVVILNEEILGKPTNREEAIKMLAKLSGKKHEVVTGVCLRTKNKKFSFSDSSYVYFAPMSIEEIEDYVDTCKPYDKAGAYGVQEKIGYTCIEKIEGLYSNIMGLPVQRLYKALFSIKN
ncbi:MAG: Maf family protein [Prevotellaceae bacterium]|jgi:septum formation protein|nr:Maf family protein [Prevotellaceae bacterium]